MNNMLAWNEGGSETNPLICVFDFEMVCIFKCHFLKSSSKAMLVKQDSPSRRTLKRCNSPLRHTMKYLNYSLYSSIHTYKLGKPSFPT